MPVDCPARDTTSPTTWPSEKLAFPQSPVPIKRVEIAGFVPPQVDIERVIPATQQSLHVLNMVRRNLPNDTAITDYTGQTGDCSRTDPDPLGGVLPEGGEFLNIKPGCIGRQHPRFERLYFERSVTLTPERIARRTGKHSTKLGGTRREGPVRAEPAQLIRPILSRFEKRILNFVFFQSPSAAADPWDHPRGPTPPAAGFVLPTDTSSTSPALQVIGSNRESPNLATHPPSRGVKAHSPPKLSFSFPNSLVNFCWTARLIR